MRPGPGQFHWNGEPVLTGISVYYSAAKQLPCPQMVLVPCEHSSNPLDNSRPLLPLVSLFPKLKGIKSGVVLVLMLTDRKISGSAIPKIKTRENTIGFLWNLSLHMLRRGLLYIWTDLACFLDPAPVFPLETGNFAPDSWCLTWPVFWILSLGSPPGSDNMVPNSRPLSQPAVWALPQWPNH